MADTTLSDKPPPNRKLGRSLLFASIAIAVGVAWLLAALVALALVLPLTLAGSAWLYLRGSREPRGSERRPPSVIEGEYTVISNG